MWNIKKRNFVVMQEEYMSTIYSLKLNREKLLDIVERITRIYGEKIEYHEENGLFDKGVNKVFTPNGIRAKHPVKGYYYYEYPLLAKSLIQFIKDPSELSQLDNTIDEIRKSKPQNNEGPLFESGIEYLPEIISAVKKKEYGMCPTESLPEIAKKLSANCDLSIREASVDLLSKRLQSNSLLNNFKNSIFDIHFGKSKVKK